MACTHDVSAHTSYLFIVKDRLTLLIAFRSSDQHNIAAAYLSVIAAPEDPIFKNLHPSAGAGRLLYMLSLRSVNIYHQIVSFPNRSDVKRRRII